MENKNEEQNIPEPGFLEQAYALIDESYKISDKLEDPQFKHGFMPRDHKLLVSVMDLHEKFIDEKIIDKFVAQIGEHYKPIMKGIKGLEEQQKTLITDFSNLRTELTNLSKTHYADVKEINERFQRDEEKIKIALDRLDKKKEEMAEMKKEIAILQPQSLIFISEEIREIKPILEWFRDTFKWWKLALFVTGITGLWFLLHWLFF